MYTPNDSQPHAIGGGIFNPYGNSVDINSLAGQALQDSNALQYGNPYPGHSVYADGESLPVSPAQAVQNQVRQAQASRMQQTAKATPIYGSGAVTQPTPHQDYMGMLQKAQDSELDSKQRWNIEPPDDGDITEGMWLGSAMVSLFVGASTGNIGQAIAAGGLAALNIHDQGYARQERDAECQKLLDQGYSYDSVYQWYESGDNKSLIKDREQMEKKREFDATNSLNIQRNNDTAINQNINAQANAARAGYDVAMPDSVDGLVNTIKSLEGGREHVMNGAGASGVYQQKQSFWNQYKPSDAPANVNDATESQQREAALTFIQQMQTKGYSPEQILAAYNQGEGSLQNALAHGGANHWMDYLKPEGQNYVRNAASRWATLNCNGNPTGLRGCVNGGINNTNGNGPVATYYDQSTDSQVSKPMVTDRAGAPKLYGTDKSGHYYMSTDGSVIPQDAVIGSSNSKQQIAGQTADTTLTDLDSSLANGYSGHSSGIGQAYNWATNLVSGNKSNADATYARLNNSMASTMADRAVASAGGNSVLKADMEAQVRAAGSLSTNVSDEVNRQTLNNWVDILARAQYNVEYYNKNGHYPTPAESKAGGLGYEAQIYAQHPEIQKAFGGVANSSNVQSAVQANNAVSASDRQSLGY